MIKLKKIKMNIILGILIGFLLSQIVILEGYTILVAIQQGSNIVGVDIEGVNYLKIFTFIIFIGTIVVFLLVFLALVNRKVHHAVCDGFHVWRFVNELRDLVGR